MDNDNYLTLNEQGLAEVSPTASQAIQNAFIDNYRQAQSEKTAEIGEAAHALGSDLEAQYGGLHGPSEYIKSRYQTPQTEQRLATLRTASQLSALNQLLSNDLANWADKAYQAKRRASARANTSSSNKGNVRGDAYDEYEGASTIGLSDRDWSNTLLPEGANVITRVSVNGALDADGKPVYYDTASNTSGTMKDTVISGYGLPIDIQNKLNILNNR